MCANDIKHCANFVFFSFKVFCNPSDTKLVFKLAETIIFLSNIIKHKSLLQIRVWRFIVPTNYLISVYVSESEFQQWISICQKFKEYSVAWRMLLWTNGKCWMYYRGQGHELPVKITGGNLLTSNHCYDFWCSHLKLEGDASNVENVNRNHLAWSLNN